MRNPTTNATRDDFNRFTRMLKKKLLAKERVLVELRDGRIVELEWYTEEGPEYESFCFTKNGCYLIWNNDGTSITSSDFDIMGTFD